MWDYQQYVIDQKLVSLRQSFTIRDPAGAELGKIERELARPKYTVTDASGGEMGRIELIGSAYNILDPAGNTLATFKPKFVRKLPTFLGLPFGGLYSVEDPQGQEIMGITGKFWARKYNMSDSFGLPLAEVSMKALSIRDSYKINIMRPDANRYLVIAAVILLDAFEHRRRAKVSHQHHHHHHH